MAFAALESYFQRERMELTDSTLSRRFNYILWQCWNMDRSDEVLVEYQNELEFRGIKYSLNKLPAHGTNW